MILVSSCLAWVHCRYDWSWKKCPEVIKLLEKQVAFIACPEQLWWLPTPRDKAEIIWDKVITIHWEDVTEKFKKWVEEVLKLAKHLKVSKAILKSRSPSCWCGKIYDWTFSWKLIDWDWLLTKALKEKWIEVITEEEIDCSELK